MFNGDIICQSELSKGANFIILVALGECYDSNNNLNANKRIQNPNIKVYQKIMINHKLNGGRQEVVQLPNRSSEIDFGENLRLI